MKHLPNTFAMHSNNAAQPPEATSTVFLQKFLRFIDLRCQIRTTPPIRVVKEHQLPVIFPYLLLGKHSFTISHHRQQFDIWGIEHVLASSTSIAGLERPLSGSFLARIRLCSKLFLTSRRPQRRIGTFAWLPSLRDPGHVC